MPMYRYTYRAEWSPEHDEYIGLCPEFSGLSRSAPTAREAVAAIEQAVEQRVEAMLATDEKPPIPLIERRCSGKFMGRTSPQLHARLMIEAVEQRVTMNHLVVQKLAERRPSALLDDW